MLKIHVTWYVTSRQMLISMEVSKACVVPSSAHASSIRSKLLTVHMKAFWYIKKSVPVYQLTLRYIPEVSNLAISDYSQTWALTLRFVAIMVEPSWNVMAHGDTREEKWRGNKRMEWVTSERHMTAEHRLSCAVQTLQDDAHTSAASSRLNWRHRRFKLTRPFRRKTKSCFCACAITFPTQSNIRKTEQKLSAIGIL